MVAQGLAGVARPCLLGESGPCRRNPVPARQRAAVRVHSIAPAAKQAHRAVGDAEQNRLRHGHGVEAGLPVQGRPNGALAEDDDERVLTTFRWPAALDGKDVAVLGSFTDWKAPVELRRSPETGDFVRTIALVPGTYQYKYRVNSEWATSPCEPITGDGSGCFNNQRLVAPSAAFHWQARWGGTEVFVTGDWCAWAELIPLRSDPGTQDFHLACSLAPGTYCYQYLVDGTWMTSPDVPVGPDDDGHLCNKMRVEDPPAFHVFYATGWRDAVLRVRTLDADGTPQTPSWREVPMFSTPSRAAPLGGAWLSAVMPATGDPARGPPQLEFVVAKGDGSAEDRPAPGRTYLCRAPGGFKLLSGRLLPFPRARTASTMLVSDLDGTMVGDGPAADAATQRFCAYWEDTAALAGSVLVYNTGRSLGQFTALWAEKRGALALPDVLITAVGTKIFLLDTQEKGRWAAEGTLWKEDAQWARRLSEGWDLGRVRQVAGEVLGRLGEGAAAWLDRGTEHPHRIALSIRGDCVGGAVEQLRAGFENAGVQVRIITSGTGGWRYVDCVSIRGGKLEALEYVRTLFSIPRECCVAAGDSGNDILMLEGANPAIVVGNAQPLLVDWLVAQQQDARVVLTDAAMADGILEGLARLGLY